MNPATAQVASPAGRVVAAVVSYQPDPQTLARVVRAVASQVERVIVVDNASGPGALDGLGEAAADNVEVRVLEANLGVGAAQNAGIAAARELGADHVLLLDQDSVCAPDMVARLMDALDAVRRRGVPVSACGPQYRGRHRDGSEGSLSGFVRFGPLKFRRVSCEDGAVGLIEADFLISSGALIPMTALDAVGPMEEGLFIDHVDTEWFLRARTAGLRCFGVCGARMEHALGEGGGRLWLGRWRYVPRHRPFRYYFIVRNSVLLYRRPYAPGRWKRGDLLRLCVIVLFNLTVRGERRERLRMMWRGLRDGLAGRDGPMDRVAGT